jgi:hypothetical protein
MVFLLEEMVAELVEVDVPQFKGQMLRNVDEDMVANIESFHHCDFILITQQNQQLVLWTVMKLNNEFIFVVVV